MFTREEKNLLIEAIKPKIQRAVADLENTNNPEIKVKKQKRIDLLMSCQIKIRNSKDADYIYDAADQFKKRKIIE